MPVENTDYGTATEEPFETPSSGASDGGGGGVMDIWLQSRVDILNNLAGGTFTNNSSFPLPGGVVNTADGYETSWSANEKGLGSFAGGKVADQDGRPLAGTAAIIQGGEVAAAVESQGTFQLSAAPPSGITSSESAPSGTFDFTYDPNIQAISVFSEDVGPEYNLGVVRYGAVTGTVTDVEGNPVEGEPVSAPGAGTATGPNGEYEFLAPGGTTVTLVTLSGGAEQTVTPGEGEELVVDWQYAGLEVDVYIPDGTGVPGATIRVPGSGEGVTDNSGKVRYKRAIPNTTLPVSFFNGADEVEIDIGNPGNYTSYAYETGFGFKGIVTDADTGGPVSGVDANVDAVEVFTSESSPDGRYVIGGRGAGEVNLFLSQSDRRYERFDLYAEVSEGEVVEEDVEVGKRTNVGTY